MNSSSSKCENSQIAAKMGRRANGMVIPGTPIAIDFWQVARQPQAKIFFLTHCHADHIEGLTGTWRQPIYTTSFNAHWLAEKKKIPLELFIPLNAGSSVEVPLDASGTHKAHVTAIDAHHVPGAVMFLFQGYFGTVLYTGDFRYYPELSAQPGLANLEEGEVDVLYLDNTYCNPRHRFPDRDTASMSILNIIRCHPHHDIKLGCRKLGREELFVFLGLALQEPLLIPPDNLFTLQLLRARDVFTTNPAEARIHLVPVSQISKKYHKLWNDVKPTISILPSAMLVGSQDQGKTSPTLKCCPTHPCCSSAPDKLASCNINSSYKVSSCDVNESDHVSFSNVNASEEISFCNVNESDKVSSCDVNASEEISFCNVNESDKVSSCNVNASEEVSSCNMNFTDKASSFTLNESDKASFCNINATEKPSSSCMNAQDKTCFAMQQKNETAIQTTKTNNFNLHLLPCNTTKTCYEKNHCGHPEDVSPEEAFVHAVINVETPVEKNSCQLLVPSHVVIEESPAQKSKDFGEIMDRDGDKSLESIFSSMSPIKVRHSVLQEEQKELEVEGKSPLRFPFSSTQVEGREISAGHDSNFSQQFLVSSIEPKRNDRTLDKQTLPSISDDIDKNLNNFSKGQVEKQKSGAEKSLVENPCTSQLSHTTMTNCVCSEMKEYENPSVPGMFAVPYSDHCNFEELRLTVALVKPYAVVPVVRSCTWSVPDASSYSDMSCFNDLLNIRDSYPDLAWEKFSDAIGHETESASQERRIDDTDSHFGILSNRTPSFKIPPEVWTLMYSNALVNQSRPIIKQKRKKIRRLQFRKNVPHKGVHYEDI